MTPPTEPTKEEWTRQDEGDSSRLIAEMQEDAKWQLQLFTFALTVTAIILGVVSKVDSSGSAGTPAGTVFLAPLIVLIPTSLMILNRARTRNRKAAFMLVYLDYKRLRIAGVSPGEPLSEVRKRDTLPWETHLHIVERRSPHLAPALLYMVSCSAITELLCIYLAFRVTKAGPRTAIAGIAAVLIADVLLILLRGRALLLLKRHNSIQGYALSWLKRKYERWELVPAAYLREFAAEHASLAGEVGDKEPSRF